MRLKRKNNPAWLVVLLCTLVLLMFAPTPAHAYTFTQPVVQDITGAVCPGPGLTRRIIPCIKDSIIYAANSFLAPFSAYMASAVAAICTVAVGVWGVMLATGRAGTLKRRTIILAVKIGAVILFTTDFAAGYFDPLGTNGGLFGMLLDSMDGMLGVVSGYAIYSDNFNCPVMDTPVMLVWDVVDCALNTLVGGILSPAALAMSLVGFLMAAIFSGSVGIFIALMGFYLILQLLFAIARSLYIYVSAYVAFALMIIISPLFIPLILFRVTKPYFDKWLRLTLFFTIQPVILFAYLVMLLAAFDAVVYDGPFSLYRALAGNNVDAPGFEIGTWLLNSNAYNFNDGIGQTAVNINPGKVRSDLGDPGGVQTGVTDTLGQLNVPGVAWQGDNMMDYLGTGSAGSNNLRFFEVNIPVPTINWDVLAALNGTDQTTFTIGLFLAMLMAVVTAYIFMNMIDYLPYMTSAIAGQPIGLPTFGMGKAAGGTGMPGEGLMDKVQNLVAGGSKG